MATQVVVVVWILRKCLFHMLQPGTHSWDWTWISLFIYLLSSWTLFGGALILLADIFSTTSPAPHLFQRVIKKINKKIRLQNPLALPMGIKNSPRALPTSNFTSCTSRGDVTYRWWRCARRRTRSRWTSAACTSSRRPSRPAAAAGTAHRTLWPWRQAGMALSSDHHLMPSTSAAFKAPSDISPTSAIATTQPNRTTSIARMSG